MAVRRLRALRRSWRATLVTAARQVPPRRAATVVVGLLAVAALMVVVPLPDAVALRDWATSVGPWFPLVFFVVHVVVTVLPVPRTAFTLAGGLLFGPLLGATLAVTASTCSALIVLTGMRALGWRLQRFSRHPRVDALDAWMSRRGWRAVLSLRLMAPVPFGVVNYAAGASSVRTLPFVGATVAGLLPGTVALMLLGDAVTGQVDPLLVAVSCLTASLGAAVLAFEVRVHRRARRGATCASTSAPPVTAATPEAAP